MLKFPEHNHELYATLKKHGIAFGVELVCKGESPCGPPKPVAEFEGAAVGSGLRASDKHGNTNIGGSRTGWRRRVTPTPGSPAQCAVRPFDLAI